MFIWRKLKEAKNRLIVAGNYDFLAKIRPGNFGRRPPIPHASWHITTHARTCIFGGNWRTPAEAGGSWRNLKIGYASLGIAILARIRLMDSGRRRPFHIPRDICLQSPHMYTRRTPAEAGGRWRNLPDATNRAGDLEIAILSKIRLVNFGHRPPSTCHVAYFYKYRTCICGGSPRGKVEDDGG